MKHDDLAQLMEPVARRLLGDPNAKLSRKNELRWGNKGSLSIDLKTGTFYDHENNEGGGVLKLIERELPGEEPLTWLRREGFNVGDDTIVATFDYRDKSGGRLYQVCRTANKDFQQRRPNGNGGWISDIKGVERVPYRLPELLRGGDGAVFIAEGEKHVNVLIRLGLRATCNSGGAGKWRREFNEYLRDQDVVILPDNDDPGRKHAENIAKGLEGVARRVRVLPLPGLKEKGDVIDWLEAGGTKDELLRLAAAAPDWTPLASGSSALVLTSAEFTAAFVPPDYLIDGLVQKRFIYSMTGPTGAGKTCLAMRVGAHVAFGLPLAGREVMQGKVLFLAGENPDDVRMRWIKLCEEMQQDRDTDRVFWRAGSLKLSDRELRHRIDAETTAHGPFALIIVDTSAAFFEGDDENSNAQLGAHARTLRSLVEVSGGPTVIVTCHPTKTPNPDNLVPRGGGAFLNEVDGNLCCQKQPDNMVVELHWHGKFRGPDFAPIPFKITAGTTERLKDSKGRLIWTVTASPITDKEQAETEDTARKRQDELLTVLRQQPGLSLADLGRAVGWAYSNGAPNKTMVNRTLSALRADGLVEKKRGFWVLTKAGQSAVRAPGPRRRNDDELPLQPTAERGII